MSARIALAVERPITGLAADTAAFEALPRVIELHPALSPLLEFESVDPAQIAVEVGMTYAYDPDDTEELNDIEWGPLEWFEATPGLAVVRQALSTLRPDPTSLSQFLYDPQLHGADVIADLEAIEHVLSLAQQQETRFHFILSA